MTIGTTVSELAPGDVLPGVEFEVTSFAAELYRQRTGWPTAGPIEPGEPIAVPPFLHVLKVVLLEHACPAGPGPEPRMHYEFDIDLLAPVRVGAVFKVSGSVPEVYVKRGRRYMVLQIDVHDAQTGAAVAHCRDTSLLGSAEPESSSAAQ